LAADRRKSETGSGAKNRIRCGFVGTSMGGNFLEEIAAKFIWKPEFGAIVERIAALLLQQPEVEVDRCIDQHDSRSGIPHKAIDEHTRTWLRSYIIHTASMLKRKSVVTRLLESGIETFGDPEGWLELCGTALKVNPDVDYLTGIGDCYRSITVNINITSCQMPTAVNQRVFDVPVSGAFIINDDQKDLEELFSSPDQYTVYHTVDELAEKVEYFSRHEEARDKIVAAARTQILKNHTYTHRLRTLLHTL
jgi:spore maturation protein CgeB